MARDLSEIDDPDRDLAEDIEHEELMEGLHGESAFDEDAEPVELGDSEDDDSDDDFDRNLAEVLDENTLNEISTNALEVIDQDRRSREPWIQSQDWRYEVLGLIKTAMDDGVVKGSSNVVYSGLIEACVRWSASALKILLPTKGPVKVSIVGDDQSEEQTERATRVERYENTSAMRLDAGYKAELKRSVMRLPVDGSVFFFSYRDPTRDVTRTEYVEGDDMIVPYGTVSMEVADHFARILKRTDDRLRRLISSGYYRDVEVSPPDASTVTHEEDDGERALDEAEGVEKNDERSDYHILYEYFAYLDLKGHEDLDDNGMETGLALPYRITIETGSNKVLAIYRDWREDDELKNRKVRIRKVDFLPGYRFYGLSLYDLLGMMSWAGTGALRLILDGSMAASVPGGFLAKDASSGLEEERLYIEPGVWKRIGLPYEQLQKLFFHAPAKEPSPALFNALSLLDESIRRLGATTDILSGNADNKAPVGTTVALIEEATKVLKATFANVLEDFTPVLQDRYEINGQWLPDEGFEYVKGDQDAIVHASDYQDDLEVAVAANPAASTTMERIVKAQAVYQLSKENPGEFDHHKVLENLLEAMEPGVEVSELLPDPSEVPDRDPVSETQALLMGKPIRAFQHQDHASHLAVHTAAASNPALLGHPDVIKALGPQMQAHMGEHLGYLFAQQIAGAGVQLPEFNPEAKADEQLPETAEFNNMIAQEAAAIAQQIAQMAGLPPPPPDPEQMRLEREQQKHQQGLQQSDEKHKQSLKQGEDKHQQKIAHDVDVMALKHEDKALDQDDKEIEIAKKIIDG